MAGNRGQYQGSVLQAIDAKARVAIPASIRGTMERNSGDRVLIIAPHPTSNCLIGYDRGWSELLAGRLERAEDRALGDGQDVDIYAQARDAFGATEEVQFDTSGRFIMPGFLRRKAGLDDLAVFVGANNTFDIWSPRLLLDAPNVGDHVKEKVEFLLSERAGA